MKAEFKIDKKTIDYFKREAPNRIMQARKNMLTAAGKAWVDESKRITRDDGHIQTGLYVNSIGERTSYSGSKDAVSPSDDDIINEMSEGTDNASLEVGSNVAYANKLEKQYNIMGRALSQSEQRMLKVATAQAKKALFGGG